MPVIHPSSFLSTETLGQNHQQISKRSSYKNRDSLVQKKKKHESESQSSEQMLNTKGERSTDNTKLFSSKVLTPRRLFSVIVFPPRHYIFRVLIMTSLGSGI